MPNFTLQFPAMGCQVQAWINAPYEVSAALLGQVPDWFEAWEARFSRFRASSELCALNASAGDFVASPEFCDVLWLALDAAALTDGLVTPLVLDAVEAAGYTHSFEAPELFEPSRAPIHPAVVRDWRDIRLDTRQRRIRLPAGSRLDFGGIVKGWAAEQVADRLAEYGPCLVDAGGDIVARGAPDESGGWRVALPVQPEMAADLWTVTLTDAALATSGVDYRRWQRDGQTLHHLIDPRTGRPVVNNVLTATAAAPSAVEAEAWAKATLIAGNCDLAENAGRAALIVRTDLSLSYNQEFATLCPTLPHPSAAEAAR